MKKILTKKLLGAVLSAAMLVASLPMAMAAETGEFGTADNWKPWLQNSAAEKADYVVTTEDSYSGNASLRVYGQTPGYQRSRIYQNVKFSGGATYNYSFYAKGLGDNSWRFVLRLGDGAEVRPSINSSEELENGWRKYYGTIPAGTVHDRFELFFDNADFDMNVLFDDFSVVKDGDETNTNILANSGFESYTLLKPTLSVTSGDSKLDISWTNPGARSTDIKLYVGDNEIAVSNLTKTANAANTAEVTGLENFKSYDVKVVCTTAFGEYTDTVVGTPKITLTGTANTWKPWLQLDAAEKADYVVTTEDSYSGNASLRVYGQTPGYQRSRIYQYTSAEGGATYNYSFYAKGLGDNVWRFVLRLGDGAEVRPGFKSSEEAENGWRKYYGTITAGTDHKRFDFFFDAADFDMNVLFDDISLVKAGDETNTNILANSGFESYTLLNTSLAVTPGDGELDITWTNPGARSTDIKLYVGDNEIALSDLTKTANATNTAKVTGLKNNTDYAVRVVCTTAFGDYEKSFTAAPRKFEDGSLENTGWYPVKKEFTATTRDSYSGNASLHIKGSIASGSTELLQITEGRFDKTSEYVITLYGKNVPESNIRVWLGDYYNGLLSLFDKEEAENGWYKYTYKTSPQTGGDYNLHVAISDAPNGVDCYIDNISIVKVGDETNTNIVRNGDFESYTVFNHGEGVKYGYAEDGYLYWTLDSSCSPSYFNIYKLTDGERVLIGKTDAADITYFELSDYAEGDRYFVTSVYESEGVETDGVELKDEVIISGIFGEGTIAEDGTIEITKAIENIQSGDILAGVQIINNTAAQINPDVYVALYEGGKLIGIQKLSANVSGRDTDGNAGDVQLAAKVSVPAEENCTVKVLTWKNAETTPLAAAEELN